MQVNQRIGEYILEESISASTLAEVWRAHHHMWTDQIAAVKIPLDPAYIANLQREGIRVHRLVHPNIVLPLAFDPKAVPPYLITQFMPGGNLRTWINLKRLTIPHAVNITRQVLLALQFGHDQGIVHGDIRPENILLEANAGSTNFAAEGSVKLTDFGVGLAAIATATASAAAHIKLKPTTLAYAAPEQREGAGPDIKSDIFAVGVILFEMLTGERPSGSDLPSELNAKVPGQLDDTFRKSYARRERRFDSAKNFLDALPGGSAPAVPAARPAPANPAAPAAAIRPPPKIGLAPLDPIPLPPPPPSSSAGSRAKPVVISALDDDGSAPIGLVPDEFEIPGAKPDEEDPEVEPELKPIAKPGPISRDEPLITMESPVRRDTRPAPGDTAVEMRPPAATAKPPSDPSGTTAAGAAIATATNAAAGAPTGPFIPAIARMPSAADHDAMYDELARKQIRTPDETKAAFRTYVEARELDEGEAVNIRVRVVKWANEMAGGQSDLDPHIILHGATARPIYIVKLILRSTRGEEAPRTAVVEHPVADPAQAVMRSDDYKLFVHLSAAMLPERFLESLPYPSLRIPMARLVREAKKDFMGRVVRMDLLVFRANLVVASYRFEENKQRAFLVGNNLTVIGNNELFARIRQEPTKRAAALLDTEQVQLGLKELRRGLETPQWQAKSATILTAFRGKMAASYVREARDQFKAFGWLESLDISARAGLLVPGHEDSLEHAALVRKRSRRLQLYPGLCVFFIFIAMAVVLNLNLSQKPQVVAQNIATSTLFAGGLAALIATLISASKIGVRMAHTDLTFYHAVLLPTFIAGAIALGPTQFRNPIGDAICAAAVIAIVVVDVLVFKYFRKFIFRTYHETQIPGDEIAVLDRIESMLKDDWEMLKPHYVQLPVLYNFTNSGTRTVEDLIVPSAGSPQDTRTVAAQKSAQPAAKPRPAPSAPAASGGGNTDRLVEQMNARIAAAIRNLLGPARVVLTLVDEYARSVSNSNLGMMQGNATKIEQKGRDLSDKLAEFERLCRSPLSVGEGDSQKIRELSQEFVNRIDMPDIKLLKSVAELATSFRQNQSEAINDLSILVPEVQAAIERLKNA